MCLKHGEPSSRSKWPLRQYETVGTPLLRLTDLGFIDLERKNPATPRQPLRHRVVTHVLGTFRYLCLRSGQERKWRSKEDSNCRSLSRECRLTFAEEKSRQVDQSGQNRPSVFTGDQRFESLSLQQRVGHEPHGQNRTRSRPEPKVRIQLSPPESPQTFSTAR